MKVRQDVGTDVSVAFCSTHSWFSESGIIYPINIQVSSNGADIPISYRIGSPIKGTFLRVGDPIGGNRWRVLKRLGSGTTGVVYLALSQTNGELVAVKTIKQDLAVGSESDISDFFYYEALAWTQVGRHPNVLWARDVVSVAKKVWVSMDYIPAPKGLYGSSLRNWIKFRRPFSLKQILLWAVQFCLGMEHALRNGIKCHRDIKPGNILIDPEKRVKIADFGLAVYTDRRRSGVVRCGTPQYMSPEQFEGVDEVDVRSDIYSFGVVLFEMSTGNLPVSPPPHLKEQYFLAHPDFRRLSWELWRKVHREQSPANIGGPLGPIILKCLEKAPHHRFQSFAELRSALLQLCRRLGIAVELPEVTGPSTHELNVSGVQLLALEMFDEAMGYFDKTLERETMNMHAINGKGLCLYYLGQHEKAIKCFQKVLDQDGQDICALVGKGLCLQGKGDFEQAGKFFQEALYVNSSLPHVWYHMGENFLGLGQQRKARKCYLKALSLLVALKCQDEACTLIKSIERYFPGDIQLMLFHIWAHRLRGQVENKLMDYLSITKDSFVAPEDDPEFAGILAGTYKRLWAAAPEKNMDKLEEAYRLYHTAWLGSGKTNTYVGINAATLALFLGRAEESRETAREIKKIYENRSLNDLTDSESSYSSYWDRATLAEAELLLGHLGKARRIYQEVMDLYREKRTYVDSSMDQIDLILPRLGLSLNAIDFCGQQPSSPGVRSVRFGITGHRALEDPARVSEGLKIAVETIRRKLPPDTVFEIISPLEEGADRIAANVMLKEFQALLWAVLPFDPKDYMAHFGGSNSQSTKEFRKFLNQAEELTILSPANDMNEAYSNAGRYVVDNCDILIAVWDGKKARGEGGTEEIVAYARDKGQPLIWIESVPPCGIHFERLDRLNTLDFTKRNFDMYKPKPIDTSNIHLSDDLLELTELLAENAHENWAKKRMDEGWTYGPERDDAAKKHPDLIPYTELSASEKEYDRKMALETLKAIIALGYKIWKE